MSDGSSTINPNNQIAERVRQQLDVFPLKFSDLGEPGELRKLVDTTRPLSGPKVRQQREAFTEQYLIEPLLHSMGYWNPVSEKYASNGPHFIRRPSEFRKIERKRPDYKLENLGSSIVCFVESKAANEELMTGSKRKATADVAMYIESDTFCKVLRNTDHRYLVGIGTDGLRWTMWSKHLKTGEVVEDTPKVDLLDIVKSVGQRHGVLEGSPSTSRVDERTTLKGEFVPAFAARNIENHVRDLWD